MPEDMPEAHNSTVLRRQVKSDLIEIWMLVCTPILPASMPTPEHLTHLLLGRFEVIDYQ